MTLFCALSNDIDTVKVDLGAVFPINLNTEALESGQVKLVDGSNASSSNLKRTKYIDISGSSKLVYTRMHVVLQSTVYGMAFYNAQKQYIADSSQPPVWSASVFHYELESVDVPDGAVYARFTWMPPAEGDVFAVYDASQMQSTVIGKVEELTGNAETIRTAVTETKNDIAKIIPLKIDSDITWTTGKAVKHSDGDLYNSSIFAASDFVDISGHSGIIYPRLQVNVTGTISHGIAFYSAKNKSSYISGITSLKTTKSSLPMLYEISIPEGAVYARFTYYLPDDERTTLYPFCIYDAEQYNNSAFETLSKKIGTTNIPLGLHTMPKSDGVLNLIKRCRQLTDIKWTPVVDLPRYMHVSPTPPSDGDYDTDDVVHYIGKFNAGTEYKGIPYGWGYIQDYGYNNGFVGYEADFETFVTAVQNPESIISKESVGNASSAHSTPYAIVCSGLTSYALGLTTPVQTVHIPDIPGLNLVGALITDGVRMDLKNLELGDVLNITAFHTAIITDIITDSNGDVVCIEECEATTVGEANPDYLGGLEGGVCRRVGFSVDDFFARFGEYSVYRYSNIDGITYTPSKYVNVGDEAEMFRFNRLPCMPYMGEGFVYKSGYIHNSNIVITCSGYGYLRVFKDGTEMANSPFAVAENAKAVDVGFTEVGNYEAYLCKMSGGSNTKVTAKCHWSVV